MTNSMFRGARTLLGAVCLILLLNAGTVLAQTSTITYQGRLTDGGTPPNTAYDFEFNLFDGASVQQGSTITKDDVLVTNGVFTVQLDFGAAAFPGGDRFLEIGVRLGTSVGAFATLSPRQQLTSSAYAIQSLTATNNVLKAGDTMTGPLNMSNQTISNIGSPGTAFTATGGLTLGDAVHASAGTAAAPAYSFAGDTNLGVFSSAADTLNFATSGVSRMSLNSSGASLTGRITANIGSASSPTFSFSGDSNTGMFSGGAGSGTLRFSTDSTTRMLVDSSGLDVTGNITLGSPELSAVGGVDQLRILRGRVSSDGTIAGGSGFTVTNSSTGTYDVSFDTAFTFTPTCVAIATGSPRFIEIGFLDSSSCRFSITDRFGSSVASGFHFIAVGAR